jgi:hypothetical protein
LQQRSVGSIFAAVVAAAALPAAAHHSFAVYDMEQSFAFDGGVETLKMRNPHMALTLTVTKDDGTQGTINFIEGAPANMIVRMGLDPAHLATGKPVNAIGAPLREDPHAYFLKAVILPDGRRFNFAN